MKKSQIKSDAAAIPKLEPIDHFTEGIFFCYLTYGHKLYIFSSDLFRKRQLSYLKLKIRVVCGDFKPFDKKLLSSYYYLELYIRNL